MFSVYIGRSTSFWVFCTFPRVHFVRFYTFPRECSVSLKLFVLLILYFTLDLKETWGNLDLSVSLSVATGRRVLAVFIMVLRMVIYGIRDLLNLHWSFRFIVFSMLVELRRFEIFVPVINRSLIFGIVRKMVERE